MNCRLCNESFDTDPSNEWPEYCNGCRIKVNEAYKDGCTIIDDTLFFINESFKTGASSDNIVDAVTGLFTPEQIYGAKKAFLDKYGGLLIHMDEELASDIAKVRKSTKKRKGEVISAKDILDALIMLDSNNFNIEVSANKNAKVQAINPEQTNMKAILARLQDMDKRIAWLENDNTHLKDDCIAFKNKIKELESNLIAVKNENNTLAQSLINLNCQVSPPSTPSSPLTTQGAPVVGVSVEEDEKDEEDEKEDEEEDVVGSVGVVSDVTGSSQLSGQTQTYQNQRNRNNKQRQRVNNNSNISAAVVANLVSNGSNVNDAISFANDVSNSYLQITKKGLIGGHHDSQWPELRQSRPGPTAKPPVAKRHLSQIAAYKKGSKGANDTRLAAAKPDWLSHKTLVIAGIDKSLTSSKRQLESMITDMASKFANYPINLLHTEILSKERSPWLTIAIELSQADFDKLYCEEAWEEGLRVREFIGRRFWRHSKRMSKTEIKNSVRHSWAAV